MNRVIRGLMLTVLSMNVLLLVWMLLDYYYAESRFFSAILISFAVLTIITSALLAINIYEPRAIVAAEVVYQAAPRAEPAPAAPAPPALVSENIAPIVAPAPAPAWIPAAEPAPTVITPVVVGEPNVPFVYEGYTLYARDVAMKNGGKRTIYFFSKRKPKSGHITAKPEFFHVGKNEKTGLPFLKKGIAPDGEDLTPNIEPSYRPQCSAITEGDKQCRNSAREASKYCSSHFGYQPPVISKAEAKREDTLPRVKEAADTMPSVRKKRVLAAA